MRKTCLLAVIIALAITAPALAGFSGSDVFLPMVGRQAGVGTSNWYTTVWIHNPGTEVATARISFLERNTVNTSPPWVDVMIEPGDTDKIENIVDTLFHKQAFGALRVTCPTKLTVTSRVYSKAVGAGEKESMGQDFAGVPASFAIGAGEKTQILGTYQTLPTADSDFRFNFGFVETTGHTVTVRVTAFDGNGTVQDSADIQVREYSQRQVAFKDYFTTTSTENSRLEVEVISGTGKVIAYGSGIANTSQDPTTFEMTYKDSLLGIANVQHDSTLTGDGTAGAPLGIADGAVTAAKLADGAVGTAQLPSQAVTSEKLADAAVTVHKLATSTPPSPGPPGVSALSADPLEAFFKTGETMFWSAAFTGDITGVNTVGGSGLQGGVPSGEANLAIAPGGVSTTMLADGAVNASKIADGTVGSDDLASSSVTLAKLSAPGGVAGQVLGTNGAALQWQTSGLTLPWEQNVATSTSSSGSGFKVIGQGGGPSINGSSDTGTGIRGTATSSSGGIGVYGESASQWGNGVWGRNLTGIAVLGSTSSGIGVVGQATANGIGVDGSSNDNYGIHGSSSTGTGIEGESGGNAGVRGVSHSSEWAGIEGKTTSGADSALVITGSNASSRIFTVDREGDVWNQGKIRSINGIEAYGDGGTAVRAAGASRGVDASASATDGIALRGDAPNGNGLAAYSTKNGYAAVFGQNPNGYGGYFVGKGYFSQAITKAGGGFKIDHPLAPDSKYLYHSFVESPDMKDIYDGNVTTDADGRAVVELPEWFEALNRDFRYQLTVIGRFAQAIVEEKVAGNRFTIRTNLANVEVSWQVTGIRKDAWAEANRLPVEEDKPEVERGSYLHPELFGQPESLSVERVSHPELMLPETQPNATQ